MDSDEHITHQPPAPPPRRPLPPTGLSIGQGIGGLLVVELDGVNIGRWVTSVDVHYDPGHYPTATVHVLDDTPEHLVPLTGVTVVRADSPAADVALNRPSAQAKLDAAELADQRAQDSI
ncbi:MAG TPA: hypothetical protein VGL46_13420 [Pseudonocardiaceae bacterium]